MKYKPQQDQKQRRESYALNMRKQLSDSDMIHENGDLNHHYFLVKKGQYWNNIYQESLNRGLEVFGVGNWKDIKEFEFGNNIQESELELRTCIMFGINDITQYLGKKFTKEVAQEIKDSNLKKGNQENKIQYGIYIKE